MDSNQPIAKRTRASSSSSVNGLAVGAASAAMADSASEEPEQQQSASRSSSLPSPFAARQLQSTEPQAAAVPRKRARQEANAAAAADHVRWLALSPAQRCFSDGLAIIFSHLTLKGLVKAARCCKGWYEGAKHVQKLGTSPQLVDASSRRLRERLSPDSLAARLLAFSTSPFRHHVRKLEGSYESKDFEEAHELSDNTTYLVEQYEKHPSAWRLVDLRQLEQLPNITRINSMLIHMAIDLHFSPYGLEGEDDSFDGYDRAICTLLGGLSACKSLTEIELTAWALREWDLTPLLKLKMLRRLTIKGWPDEHFGPDQMAVVKQIATLQSLRLLNNIGYHVYESNESWLTELCRPPHQLQQLEELNLSKLWIFEEEILQLQHLPALTTLEPYFFSLMALPGLAEFPHLICLSLALDGDEDVENGDADWDDDEIFDAHGYAHASLFLPYLRCTGLEELKLEQCVFSDEEAETLCQLLPQLTTLSLQDVGWPSLEPLRHLTKLTELLLRPLHHCSLTFKLAHLQALESLQMLTLEGMHPPLGRATVAALRPPSALMPSLKSFNPTPRGR